MNVQLWFRTVACRLFAAANDEMALLDIITDPTIGYLSDNTRSRWGRRRPWMFCGALLAAMIAILR